MSLQESITMINPYYSFNQYLRKTFGERVHRISIHAGFTCPNLDGALSDKGCLYCDNRGFSPYSNTKLAIVEQITKSIEFYEKRYGVKKFIAYFQSFSNTYGTVAHLKNTYDIIKQFPQIRGISIATRPDCIDEEKIKLIASYQPDYLVWLEYGLQTTHDECLKQFNRNHTYAQFLKALELTRGYHIPVAAHVILGFPSLTHEQTLDDARIISQLDIQAIKFHVLHILKDTPLHGMHQKQKIDLLTKEKYIPLICDYLELLPKNLVVMRMVSTAHPEHLVAPKWINNKTQVLERIREEFKKRQSYQGYRYNAGKREDEKR